MSTEERDKALEKYADWCHERGHSIDRVDFSAGWDARGQVTPDRSKEPDAFIAGFNRGVEAGRKVKLSAESYEALKNLEVPLPNGYQFLKLGKAGADAILALFNEKGNE